MLYCEDWPRHPSAGISAQESLINDCLCLASRWPSQDPTGAAMKAVVSITGNRRTSAGATEPDVLCGGARPERGLQMQFLMTAAAHLEGA